MHDEFMAEAIKMAREAKLQGEFPFGAVIVKDGKIVSRAMPLEKTYKDVSQHAELLAVRGACQVLETTDLSDCVIYASGEPCMMCASIIFHAGIKQIYIGATRDDLPHFFSKKSIRIFQLSEDINYKPQIVTGLLKDQVIALFKDVKK